VRTLPKKKVSLVRTRFKIARSLKSKPWLPSRLNPTAAPQRCLCGLSLVRDRFKIARGRPKSLKLDLLRARTPLRRHGVACANSLSLSLSRVGSLQDWAEGRAGARAGARAEAWEEARAGAAPRRCLCELSLIPAHLKVARGRPKV